MSGYEYSPGYDHPGAGAYSTGDSATTINHPARWVTTRPDAAPMVAGTAAESGSLGRALLLADTVAAKTMADADAKAAEIIRVAEAQAAAIIATAQSDARRLVAAAQDAAAELFCHGEAQLLSAVGAFIDGSNMLRVELDRVRQEATNWRAKAAPQTPPQYPVGGSARNVPESNGARHADEPWRNVGPSGQ